MKERSIKVITFDLDDTLWETKPVLVNAEIAVYSWLEQHAPKLTAQMSSEAFFLWRIEFYKQHKELNNQISKLRLLAMQEALIQTGYNPQEAIEKAQKAFDYFLDHRHKVSFFNTVQPLLSGLHTNYSLGVLTNGNADIFKLTMGEFFNFALCAEELNTSKPELDHFSTAQKICGTEPQQMIHIGDHIEHDVMGANNAGWHSIWFNPKQTLNTQGQQPSQTVQCLSEIPQAILAIEENL